VTRRIAALGIALLALIGLTALLHQPLNRFRSLLTLRKVDDYPLYVMRYYGDYGFERYLREGTASARRPSDPSLALEGSWACTCFAALGGRDGPLFGRNFDWTNHQALLLFTDPPGGYASVSMVDLSYLGLSRDPPSWAERVRLLRAPYWAFDGMNEHGLAVGLMAVPHAEPGRDPRKRTLGSLEAVRLVLDHARDVREAAALLQTYNLDFGGGPPLHYLVADASGRSAVLEYIASELVVLPNESPWQVATNFVISEEMPEAATSSCWRYNKVYATLQEAGGRISGEVALDLLADVSQGNTMWSVVYEQAAGDVRAVVGRQYAQVHDFRLPVVAGP
jgi:hypothetical protein